MVDIQAVHQDFDGHSTKRPPMRPRMNQRQRGRAEQIINPSVVKERRRALGFTQMQLAIMSACSPRTIALIERGKSLDPSTSVTLRIAKALSIHVEALCAGSRPYSSRTALNALPEAVEAEVEQ